MEGRFCSDVRRGSRHAARLMVLGGVVFAAACDSVVAPEALAPREAVSTLTAAEEAAAAAVEPNLRQVTRAIAVAIEDRAVRHAVRDGLRDSPWSQHKVVLQDFLASAEGQIVLQGAARAAGLSEAEFSARVAALPPLDFYVPSRDTRRTWQGTPNVTVVGTLNTETKRGFGYDTKGQDVTDPMNQRNQGHAVLLLHPAESKLPRSRPQPRGRGEVIQSAEDGELAERLVWYYPNGDSVVVDIEEVRAGRDSRFKVMNTVALTPTGGVVQPTGGVLTSGSVSPTPINPSPTTYAYLDYFKINFDDGWGNVELRIDAKFYGPAGDYYGFARYSNDDVAGHSSQSPGVPLIAHIPPVETDARIWIEVWEDDCGCFGNNNDYYGWRNFTWYDRDQTRSIYKGSTNTADVELNWVARARSQLARYVLPDVWVQEGNSAQAVVTALDQYGYRLVNQQHTVSNWWTGSSYIASVSSMGGAYASVYGNVAGTTNLYATVGSTTLSATVTVEAPYSPPCDPYDPYSQYSICPM